MTAYVVPIFLICVVLFACYKKVSVYDCFVDGGKEGLQLIYTVFPYISAVFIAIALFRASGLSVWLTALLAKPLGFLGIPEELAEMLILRPLSGNGSLALLENIFSVYGADSRIGRTAAVIYGSSETVFYVAAVYFSAVKVKKLRGAIPIALIASLIGAVVAAAVVRLL